jgi:hypothetical protein
MFQPASLQIEQLGVPQSYKYADKYEYCKRIHPANKHIGHHVGNLFVADYIISIEKRQGT